MITPTPPDPGCFWHGAEEITATTYLVCGECGHAYQTRADLEAKIREQHVETDAHFISTGYPASPLPETIDVDAWPCCPLCTHDL